MFKAKVNNKLLTKNIVQQLFSPGNIWHGKKEILASDLAMYNEIDVAAFQDQRNLLRIEIPSSIQKIGNGAFIDCLRLQQVILPETIKTFGLAVFGGCFSLKKVNIPSNFNYIPTATFADCSLLQNIELHENIKKIGSRAFANCLSLKNIFIPSSVEVIKEDAFINCPSLEKGIFGSNFYYQAHHFGLFEEQFNVLNVNLKSKVYSEFLYEQKLINNIEFTRITDKIKIVKFVPRPVTIIVPKPLLKDKPEDNLLTPIKQSKSIDNTTTHSPVVVKSDKAKENNSNNSSKNLNRAPVVVKKQNKVKKAKKSPAPKIPEDQKHTIVPLEKYLYNYNYEQRRKDWHKFAGHNDKQLVCWGCKDDDNWETILLDNNEHVCYYCWVKKPANLKKKSTTKSTKKSNALVVKKQPKPSNDTKPKKVNGIEVTKKHVVLKSSELEKYNYDKRRKQWHSNAGYSEKGLVCSSCKETKHTSVLTDQNKHICYNCFIKKPVGNKAMFNPKTK